MIQTINLIQQDTYFHAAPPGQDPGTRIAAGHYGNWLREQGYSLSNDHCLEFARDEYRLVNLGHLPSRHGCNFFCLYPAEAELFRNEWRPEWSVYSVKVLDPTATACYSYYKRAIPESSNALTAAIAKDFPREYWADDRTYPNYMEVFANTDLEIIACVA
jgi:hypothetical protein